MQIHPTKFATQRQAIKGELPLAAMERLSAFCQQELTGVVNYELLGDIDWSGTSYLQLNVHANIPQQCQRCLKQFIAMVASETRLSPVFSEADAEKLPAEYDPLVLTKDELDLATLVEDELLLAISSTPKHDLKDCSVKETSWDFGGSANDSIKENPFAKLKK